MAVKWKKGPRFQPEVVLKEIAKIRLPKLVERAAGFDAIGFTQTVPLLHTMLEFPPAAAGLDHGPLISSAIGRVEGELTAKAFLEELNRCLELALKKRINHYKVLTTISLSANIRLAPVTIDGVRIRFLRGEFPKGLLAERASRISRQRVPASAYSDGCIKVIAEIDSKSTGTAFAKAIRSIDLYRALWCFASNSQLELFGCAWTPINIARLGGIHTVHGPSGQDSGIEQVWFEPHQAPNSAYKPSDEQNSKRFVATMLGRIQKSSYFDALCDALVLYVRALDEWNASTAFVKLWLALERLTCPERSDYDLTVRRVAFLFSDTSFATQTMEHLRAYRNNCVHSGSESPYAKGYCYTLQRNFRELFLFHLRNVEKFKTLAEANAFLDLPTDIAQLDNIMKRVKGAKKFRSPTPRRD